MTNNDTLAAIATEIETLSAELLKVNGYIDILGKPAMIKANEIDKALADAKERFADALTVEQVEARKLRLSHYSDIRISTAAEAGANLFSTTFTISYTKDTWDLALNATVPKQHSCIGFAALDNTAYEYLMTVKPEAIPAQIMALAPGKPEEAMDKYFTGLRRGYFKG